MAFVSVCTGKPASKPRRVYMCHQQCGTAMQYMRERGYVSSKPCLVRAVRHARVLLGVGQPSDQRYRRGREARRRKKHLNWQSLLAAPRVRAAVSPKPLGPCHPSSAPRPSLSALYHSASFFSPFFFLFLSFCFFLHLCPAPCPLYPLTIPLFCFWSLFFLCFSVLLPVQLFLATPPCSAGSPFFPFSPPLSCSLALFSLPLSPSSSPLLFLFPLLGLFV